MKIQLKSFFHFDITEILGDSYLLDINADKATIRDILVEVRRRSKDKIKVIDHETGDIDVDHFVLLNGRDVQGLPKGLNTRVKEGDEVGIGMMYHWGGG